MTHEKISGYERVYKVLINIEEIIRFNYSIILESFKTKNTEILDNLVKWNPDSIEKIKERLLDFKLKWTKDLNKIVPNDKYGKAVSNASFEKIKRNLMD